MTAILPSGPRARSVLRGGTPPHGGSSQEPYRGRHTIRPNHIPNERRMQWSEPRHHSNRSVVTRRRAKSCSPVLVQSVDDLVHCVRRHRFVPTTCKLLKPVVAVSKDRRTAITIPGGAMVEEAARSVRGCACEFFPSFHTTLERTHTSDPLRFQEKRHTGARGLVWSTAKENNLSVPWNLLAASGEVFGRNPNRPWDDV
jgi:hypothetical protein